MSIAGKDTGLLGKTKEDYAAIISYMSFMNMEAFPKLFQSFAGIIGREPYNKKISDTGAELFEKAISIFEAHLTKNTYLVGERVTLADLFCVSMLTRGYQFVFDDEWRKSHPAVQRWWSTVANQSVLSPFIGNFEYISEPAKYTPPKKEAKPKKEEPKKEAKPKKEKEQEEEPEDDVPKEKKVAHPLAALGNAKMVLDNWKRVYSNEDTREKALPWFWENYDPEEWSLWKVAYKYNDELTMTFMSNNLVGGFFNRLSASTKYLFGSCVVYGENNNNGIVGAFLVRGQDFLPAFEVAPDWESYEFTKLDASNAQDKDFVEHMWAWDKPVNGQEIADGKVFK